MYSLSKKNSLIPPMHSFFDEIVPREILDWSDKNFSAFGSTLPSANVEETDKQIHIELAAPGLKKNDFKIEYNNHLLSISSEQKEEKVEKDKKGNFERKEFSYQSFCRSFRLPETIDESKIDATYKDGILHIDVAKKLIDAPKSVKSISVK